MWRAFKCDNAAHVAAILTLGWCCVADLEGLQVAILALERVPNSRLASRPRAQHLHRLSVKGKNVQRFLVGRQFFVVFVVYLSAQLTTYPTLPDMGMPAWVFTVLIQTGLPGALVVLAFGQLMPQLIAATHPIAFMNLPGSYAVVWIALTLERVGITHFSWLLMHVVKRCTGMHKRSDFDDEATHDHAMGDVEDARARDGLLRGDGDTISDAGDTLAWVEADLGMRARTLAVMVRSASDVFTEEASAGTDTADAYVPDVVKEKRRKHVSHDESKRHDATTPDDVEIRTGDDGGEYGGSEGAGDDGGSADGDHTGAYVGWGFTPNSERYPMPSEIVEALVREQQPVPRFLLPPYHEKHVPPHIVAYSLYRRAQNDAALMSGARRAARRSSPATRPDSDEDISDEATELTPMHAKLTPGLRAIGGSEIHLPALAGPYDSDSGSDDGAGGGVGASHSKRERVLSEDFFAPELEEVLTKTQRRRINKFRMKYRSFRAGYAAGSHGEVVDAAT